MPIDFERRQGNVVFVRVSGQLTDADYKDTFIPAMEETFANWTGIRMLFIMEEGFRGWDLHSAWDEFRFEFKHRHDIVKVGVVGDERWEQWATRLSKLFTGANVRFFPAAAADDAREWTTSGF